jgi:Uncharacterized conserved protein
MRTEPEDFTFNSSSSDHVTVEGVLRLASPADYESRFEPLRRGVETASGAFTLDISRVRFINSSGITALSRLVLHARSLEKPLVMVGLQNVAWQGTTLSLFKRLYKQVDVQLM